MHLCYRADDVDAVSPCGAIFVCVCVCLSVFPGSLPSLACCPPMPSLKWE